MKLYFILLIPFICYSQCFSQFDDLHKLRVKNDVSLRPIKQHIKTEASQFDTLVYQVHIIAYVAGDMPAVPIITEVITNTLEINADVWSPDVWGIETNPNSLIYYSLPDHQTITDAQIISVSDSSVYSISKVSNDFVNDNLLLSSSRILEGFTIYDVIVTIKKIIPHG